MLHKGAELPSRNSVATDVKTLHVLTRAKIKETLKVSYYFRFNSTYMSNRLLTDSFTAASMFGPISSRRHGLA
jgi:hypothetical protein